MFSTAVASACLTVLQWLLWLTAGLLLLLLVVQSLRGDADAQPVTTAVMAVAAGVLGWMFGAAGRRLAAR
ncbi:hypothetical protein GCM10007036_31560 [Alsobacter metallidurans]|uniref:Uncharacterized protein n=1 Tax=Alsobacter metallidurans TaxID=340221 RepID=A0A917MIP8_9HYPH|nr:hypothetical protein [Alsobacter metallidurans]GGH24855.1 hypothetical protein GCM10007036_31560 [Alsobacter metallidurans]